MTKAETTPKDAAAIILLRNNTNPVDPEVFWVRRSPRLAFLGGFNAFPGGQLDQCDTEVQVADCDDPQAAAAISCAARELFEELGVLATRGGEQLTKGQRVSILDDLTSGRMSWPQILQHYELHLDAADFTFVGRWVTPPFSARRFDTWFFLLTCPSKQEPSVIPGELESGEWISASNAVQKWRKGRVVAVPPTLHALTTLASGMTADLETRFLAIPEASGQVVRRIEFRPNYICFPVRTPTKPPATHTNCYLIYTSEEVLIVDPGSPYEGEQAALAETVNQLLSESRRVHEIVLTHRHRDHVAGVNALQSQLPDKVDVAAHLLTAEALKGTLEVNRLIQDNDQITLDGEPQITLQAMHTPGHARGHLCLYDEPNGTLLSGDNVVGLGSVLIDPPEGNMRQYFDSLQRMAAVPKLSLILGGHGPAIANPHNKLDEYINHRRKRENEILKAVGNGAETTTEIVQIVYTDVSPKLHPMAKRAILAHLEKLAEDGLVRRDQGKWKPMETLKSGRE